MLVDVMLIEERFVERNEQWILKAKELYNTQQVIKKYEKIEEDLLKELKDISNNEASFGGGFKFNRIVRRGNIDYKVIPQLHGLNLDKYRKEDSVCWKLTYENFELVK